ncbi:unnamed protein product [Vitrella brassicaformis CCMP3155]|uniref:Uncharacterized protein n=1 Tax=Vitrella brassicaformis (strain CCMP3155) TaxID=1169540 RepID=A0A0G4GA49_VITBC|nr:unnamed protein product [Vitrella brassicaformis CCMP3155]|eukprot:CEM25743.1 unnamed protein product [Vitrella brassicaformis CCMP3155]
MIPIGEAVRPPQSAGDQCEDQPAALSTFSSNLSSSVSLWQEQHHDVEVSAAGTGNRITATTHGDDERRASFTSATSTAATFKLNEARQTSVPHRESSGRLLRRELEERIIDAMVGEFREAAGYEAAHEEWPTTLEYKTINHPDGTTTEVLVGATFQPEPLCMTTRRVFIFTMQQLAANLAIAIIFVGFALIYASLMCSAALYLLSQHLSSPYTSRTGPTCKE